jgi:uncharacterized membrane protein YoaK (UPF0700 family)
VKNLPAEHDAGMFLSIMLAFVGGYADAYTYITARVFAGPISGNSILATISIISRDWRQAAVCTTALLCMVLAIAGSSLLDTPAVRSRRVPPLLTALLLEAVLFLVPGTLAFADHPLPPLATTALLCVALGLQTGTLRRTNGVTVYTAFVAGMVTQLVEGQAKRVQGKEDSPADDKMMILARLVAAFVTGAAAATAMTLYARRVAVGAPGFLLLVLAAVHLRRASEERGG